MRAMDRNLSEIQRGPLPSGPTPIHRGSPVEQLAEAWDFAVRPHLQGASAAI
jgi:hypothetical protein